jgi:sodium/bile acid cotransporter 3/5
VNGTFDPSEIEELVEGKSVEVVYVVHDDDTSVGNAFCNNNFTIHSSNKDVARAKHGTTTLSEDGTSCNINITVKGHQLGFADVVIKSTEKDSNGVQLTTDHLSISVIRQPRLIDDLFTISVMVLVSISYISMGCTLDVEIIRSTVKRPVGPVIGVCCQYIFMPLVRTYITISISAVSVSDDGRT